MQSRCILPLPTTTSLCITVPDYHPLDQMLIPMAFVTNHEVPNSSSQAVAVIGSTPELGRWRAMNAKAMFEVQPNVWATIVYLPRGVKFRYKFVIIEKNRNKVNIEHNDCRINSNIAVRKAFLCPLSIKKYSTIMMVTIRLNSTYYGTTCSLKL